MAVQFIPVMLGQESHILKIILEQSLNDAKASHIENCILIHIVMCEANKMNVETMRMDAVHTLIISIPPHLLLLNLFFSFAWH